MLIHIKISIYDTFCAFSTNKQYGILKNASVKFLVRCVLAVALLFHWVVSEAWCFKLVTATVLTEQPEDLGPKRPAESRKLKVPGMWLCAVVD